MIQERRRGYIMILTKEEYLALGFDGGESTQGAEKLLINCLKRAEYVLNGLTDGAAARTVQRGGIPSEYVKQACGFQAQAMLRYETLRAEICGGSESESGSESSGSSQSSESSEKVTIGDFSYSVSSGSSSGNSSGSSSGSSSNGAGESDEAIIQPFETNTTVIKLLRAAGCLFGAVGVRE